MLDMDTHGFPDDWYWSRQDGKAFSSDRIAVVGENDAAYRKWRGDGRVASRHPRDLEENDSVDELQITLDRYNLHATLEHYAGGIRYSKVQEPLTVEVAGKAYRFQTDETSSTKLDKAVQLGEQFEALNGEGSFKTVWKTADGFTDTALTLSDLKSVGLAIGMNEAGLFALEAQVVAGLADGSLSSKADVEAAFDKPFKVSVAKAKRSAKAT